MPTTVNLTFTLDDQTFDPYHHTGDSSKSGFLPNVNVFFADGLANAPHTVRVDIGPNSVFLFDYLVYTQVRSTGDAESSNSDEYVQSLLGLIPSSAVRSSYLSILSQPISTIRHFTVLPASHLPFSASTNPIPTFKQRRETPQHCNIRRSGWWKCRRPRRLRCRACYQYLLSSRPVGQTTT